MKHYDIVISGGAMAGSTLALGLAHLDKQHRKIAIVESFEISDSHPGFDARCIALSHGTVNLLKKYQLWSEIEPHATAIERIHVSEQGRLAMTDIDAQQERVDALGHVVELQVIGRLLRQRLDQCANIDFLCPNQIVGLDRHPDSLTLELDDGQQLVTSLLVAADGGQSKVAELCRLPADEEDFKQHAIIANVSTDTPHAGCAFERFTPQGPIALLPMSENRLSLVWCMPPDIAAQRLDLDNKAFLQQLQKEFGWRLGRFEQVGQRHCYPLVLKQRHAFTSHRVVCVGNAAQALHPIAGQGFNLGIRDVASLIEELLSSEDFGSASLLQRYQQRRIKDKQSTVGLTRNLVHLFSNDLPLMRLGRDIGLVALDKLPGIKHPLLTLTLGRGDR
ncbi:MULTISPECIES: 2-octaprenyl-6-methoxyphenyl hydroxylase [unclassified Vibrio]|uniref:2-octaprenyl-6-methoxyphenyl hydroxylase n=1 Tax=Vibrio sp. HB236076 TaxID=3232307 RepID=A0AB39HCJ1_9VIBR|nr:2-octaprenyl-6-methoxyphenyl hydroxylase [Vibrio sp. HB161653]MDP5253940.1 2-octaprenyl-6-methoxyphenyl hydroxylase [Vibrio sp. HB161653]